MPEKLDIAGFEVEGGVMSQRRMKAVSKSCKRQGIGLSSRASEVTQP